MKLPLKILPFITVLLFSILFTKNALSQNESENPFVSVIKQAKPAIVSILVKKFPSSANDTNSLNKKFFETDLIKDFLGSSPNQQKTKESAPVPTWGYGSGFIISSDGFIVTNHHVIKNSVEATVTLQNRYQYKATVIGSDAQSDIALLRIDDSDLPTIKLGNSDTMQVGEWAIAIGSPIESTQTVTVGIISAKGRSNIGISEYEDFIQTDAAINHGNSGGPLLNIHGEVIGVNTAFMTQKGGYNGVGFAVPISMVKAIISQIKIHGKMTRGWLGVSLTDCQPDVVLSLNDPKYSRAVKILTIRDDSPAKTGGLEPEDLVVAINRKNISGAADLRNKIAMTKPGTKISIQFFRDKSLQETSIIIAKYLNTSE